MAVHPHHPLLIDRVQARIVADDCWSTEVVPRLSAALAVQARLLDAWGTLIQLAHRSAVAWGTRLEAAFLWLHWLIGALLATRIRRLPPADLRLRRILRIDTTRLRRVGGTGDDQRLRDRILARRRPAAQSLPACVYDEKRDGCEHRR
ncbi:MAG: hypothetical protein KatS3mg057_1630 [Herpetosiphonaceae bacterium]|nr:MAG: hypothetical protein KatS3mg057_1630 [Herpetosiphonaceae bacterium]